MAVNPQLKLEIVRKLVVAEHEYGIPAHRHRELVHRGEKEGRISFWLQTLEYEQAKFREAWYRVGRG